MYFSDSLCSITVLPVPLYLRKLQQAISCQAIVKKSKGVSIHQHETINNEFGNEKEMMMTL